VLLFHSCVGAIKRINTEGHVRLCTRESCAYLIPYVMGARITELVSLLTVCYGPSHFDFCLRLTHGAFHGLLRIQITIPSPLHAFA
jgi:hypothetical protein